MSETFGAYGECECRLIMDKQRGTPKGIGFVEYSSVDEMKAAIGKFFCDFSDVNSCSSCPGRNLRW